MGDIVMSDMIGKKITAIRAMTSDELETEGWGGDRCVVIELEDGTLIYPSSDEEGNRAGSLFAVENGEQVHILPL
mgnify:CR=1 FL=1